MTPADLAALETIVRTTAREELRTRFGHTTRRQKPDGSWLTEADLAMQSRLQSALADCYPEIALLGEEMSAAEQERLLAQAGTKDAGLWLLDPLDGTSNFSAGIPLFSVSLALMRHGRIEAGIVYDPMHDESFAALRGHGATLNGALLRAPVADVPMAKAIACIDFKRLPATLAARITAAPPYSSQRSVGTVALEWCWVAAGRSTSICMGARASGTMRPAALSSKRPAALPIPSMALRPRSASSRDRPSAPPTGGCSSNGGTTCE